MQTPHSLPLRGEAVGLSRHKCHRRYRVLDWRKSRVPGPQEVLLLSISALPQPRRLARLVLGLDLSYDASEVALQV